MKEELTALLRSAQPNAVAFGGEGISPNPLRWCGAESSFDPPGWPSIYSTDCSGSGGGCPPNTPGAVWSPSGMDATLQQGDHWFYSPGDGLHSLEDLKTFYHKSVGANAVLELDFVVSRTGQLAPSHVEAYAAFGACVFEGGLGSSLVRLNSKTGSWTTLIMRHVPFPSPCRWIKACYGTPLAFVEPPVGASSALLTFATPTVLDRVQMREDLAFSQLVSAYTVEYQATPGGAWLPLSSGITVGNKRIDVFDAAVTAVAVQWTVSASLATPLHLLSFAAFSPVPCLAPSSLARFERGGLCLVSNDTAVFPCPGGAHNACPVFLGDCSAATAVWDDATGALMNPAASQPGNPAGINVDCNSDTPHTVVKLLRAGGGQNPISFTTDGGGQLRYAASSGAVLCLNDGDGPLIPPCGGESHADRQVQVMDCSDASSTGWTRVAVPHK